MVARGLSWSYQADNVIAGIENPISIDAEVTFTDDSSNVRGDYLWRLGLYGSKFRDGSGEKFNYNRQVLNDAESSLDLVSTKLTFSQGAAMFDVAAIGCTEYIFSCMEFTKNEEGQDFAFSVFPEGDVLTLCKESPCLANVKIVKIKNSLLSGKLQSYRPSNRLAMKVSVTGAEVGVSGKGLWQLRAFGSGSRDGSGKRYGEVVQVLNNRQQNQMLSLEAPMVFQSVSYDLDASDASCRDIRYVCVELEKGPNPDVVFNLVPVPDSSVMVSCVRLNCEGLLYKLKAHFLVVNKLVM